MKSYFLEKLFFRKLNMNKLFAVSKYFLRMFVIFIFHLIQEIFLLKLIILKVVI